MGLALVALGGCGAGGPSLYEVKGKVTHNGAAVSGATLTFMNAEGKMSTGTTNAQGEYALVTFGRPGALPGDYKVGITKIGNMAGAPANPKPEDMIKMMQGKSMPKQENELPGKYAAPQTSGLTATVTTDPTKNVFTFDLKDD
jgi:hypothetical protein